MLRYFRIIIFLFPLFLVGIFFVIQSTRAQMSTVVATVDISICGNLIAEPPAEACDNYDLNDQTCVTQNFDAGDLACNPDCTLDTSACYDEESSGDSGGGGGGGRGTTPQTGVKFKGYAYPLNDVIVLKDGQLIAGTIAGPDAQFSISLTSLSPGTYNFAVYGEDSEGRRSSLFTFNVYITQGAVTTISGIFITPTISTDKSQVRRGDNISIFGQTTPDSDVTIAVNSDDPQFGYVSSNEEGVYFHDFDSSVLELGDHSAKSKTTLDNQISEFGRSVAFVVGNANIVREGEDEDEGGCSAAAADVNCDVKVNLVDFSIAAYWYKRSDVPSNVDLNNDGKVDLIDFSIMAYYWTG